LLRVHSKKIFEHKYENIIGKNGHRTLCLIDKNVHRYKPTGDSYAHTLERSRTIKFTTQTQQAVTTGSKYIEIGTIDANMKLNKINVNVSAKEQAWGNLCSWINIFILRNGKNITGSTRIHVSTKPRTTNYMTYKDSKSYKPIVQLEAGDKVMLQLYSPSPGCMVGIKNATVSMEVEYAWLGGKTEQQPHSSSGTCNLKRGQEVYPGCGYIYGEKSERNKQCGNTGQTSKWIGDGMDPCTMKRGQMVYTGCGYTYGSEEQRNKQFGNTSQTSKWIGDGLTGYK